jgi:prevent-host-death family protein
MTMKAEAPEQLADLIKQVQAGNEILLTQGNTPVAKLISASATQSVVAPLKVTSLQGHRVLTSTISQSDLADELFNGQ